MIGGKFSRLGFIAGYPAAVLDEPKVTVSALIGGGYSLDYLPAARAQVGGSTLSFAGNWSPSVEQIETDNYLLLNKNK